MSKGNKRMSQPRQEALFEEDRTVDVSALVAVTVPEGTLSAPQRTFNRLTARIRRGREALAAWETYMPRFQKRITAELQPIEDEIDDAQRRLVEQLHALLSTTTKGERLSRKYRSQVRSLLLQLIDGLLQNGPDPMLEALHDSYSDVTHADQREQNIEIAKALFGGMLDPETAEGSEEWNGEEPMPRARNFADDKAKARAKSASGPRGHSIPAAERKAQSAREASLSVREVYRKLVSALHPDRESDTTEHQRKTGLMQRANQAYERNDLLELLALQIETEQIDSRDLANMPEARLRHYNQVLLDQAQTLEAQVAEQMVVFRMEFNLKARDVTPLHVDQALSVRITGASAVLDQIRRDSTRLADPRRRNAVLDELAAQEDDTPDFEDIAALAAVFSEMSSPARPATRRRRR